MSIYVRIALISRASSCTKSTAQFISCACQFRPALMSPFSVVPFTAIPPSAALCEVKAYAYSSQSSVQSFSVVYDEKKPMSSKIYLLK
jgi:hypothetical protein